MYGSATPSILSYGKCMNKAKCTNCNQVLESKHRHDFVQCKCRIESDVLVEKFLETLKSYDSALSLHSAACAFEETVGHGIFIDGGNEYSRRGGNLNDLEEI